MKESGVTQAPTLTDNVGLGFPFMTAESTGGVRELARL